MVPPGGFEPPASPLPRECSTPELRRRMNAGAAEYIRFSMVVKEYFD